jgi:hypothetical protein
MIVHIVKGLSETRIEFTDPRIVMRLERLRARPCDLGLDLVKGLGRIEIRDKPISIRP